MEDGHFLRRSVNDITSRLDINFGSLGRPARGGRGRGRRGALTGTPENVAPKFERVGALICSDYPGYCYVLHLMSMWFTDATTRASSPGYSVMNVLKVM